MTEKESRRVKTLSGFMKWAAQFNDGEYLFRGVSNHSYKIEASACRRLPKVERDNPARLLRINKRLIEEAKSRGHDQKNGQQLFDLELLAELQHFSAATCLIDFSRNALVALWFACQQSSKGKSKNGKIFAVRSDDPARFKTVTTDLIEKDIDHFFKLDELGKYPLYQWEPKLQNNRIMAQHSVFVFGGAQVDTEAECVIIQSSKQEILKSLDQLSDVTEASMYPDFDGFARLHAPDRPYIEPNARGYLQRGIGAHQRADLADAIAYYTEVIRLDPGDISIVTQAYYNRGFAYEQRGDYEHAIIDFGKVIELNPNYDNVYYNRGLVHEQRGDYELAIIDFGKVIEFDPNRAEAYFTRGLVHERRNDYEYAIIDFDKAIELNPNYVTAYFARGLVHGQRGDYELAIVDCNYAIELDPNNSDVYSARAAVYGLQGDYERAIADCTYAIELDSNNPNVYNARGFVYYKRGDYERAIVNYTKTIELNPDDAVAYHNRGEVQLHLEKWDEAKMDLTIAKEKGANIVNMFRKDYESVADFQSRTGITLPADIAEMLTPTQNGDHT